MIEQKIEIWKTKLLDLGKRNRLINFRETKRSNIKIISPEINELFQKLVIDENELHFPYFIHEEVDEEGDVISEKTKEGDIETDRSVKEQQKTLRSIRSKSKTAEQEQGINILYLSFGLLSWKESDDSEIIIKSPLLLVPVTLALASIAKPFILGLHEDEIVINPSLQYKFENDFGITLPAFDEYEDDLKLFLNDILELVKVKGWDVDYEAHLTLLSFLKINMYKDLEENLEKIKSHKIINALANNISDAEDIPDEYNSYDHDNMTKPIEAFQVVDADSSQQDAILYAKKGYSFILHGPPGTGKSQTITNIIAESLAEGKTVLFVSEKMAALEVVYKRLVSCDLAEFCLPLHNHKAKKKDVISDLGKTLFKSKTNLKRDSFRSLDSLKEYRDKLNQYKKELHEIVLPLDINIFEANGQLAKVSYTKDIIFDIEGIEGVTEEKLSQYIRVLESFIISLRGMEGDYKNNPWYGCNIEILGNKIRQDITSNLSGLVPILNEVSNLKSEIGKTLYCDINISIKTIDDYLEILEHFSQSPLLPVEWVKIGSIEPLINKAKIYRDKYLEKTKITDEILEKYTNSIFDIRAEELTEQLAVHISKLQILLNKSTYNNDNDIEASSENIYQSVTEYCEYIKKVVVLGEITKSRYNFKKVKSIKDCEDLVSSILSISNKLNAPELWFDSSKFDTIKNIIEDTNHAYTTIIDCEDKLLSIFESDILKYDFEPVLRRFKIEYSSIFKVFKKDYKRDKKEIISYYKSIPKKVSDVEILTYLQILKEKSDSNVWIDKNKEIIERALGKHYLNRHTDWKYLKCSFSSFIKIYENLGDIIHNQSVKSILIGNEEIDESVKSAYKDCEKTKPSNLIIELQLLLNYDDLIADMEISKCQEILDNINNEMLEFINKFTVTKRNSKQDMTFDEHMINLQRIGELQSIENNLKDHKEELLNQYAFLYKEESTDWDALMNALLWAEKFNEYDRKYNFSEELKVNVCTDSNFVALSKNKKNEMQDLNNQVQGKWEWLTSIFDVEADLENLEIDTLGRKISGCYTNFTALEEWIDFKNHKNECEAIGLTTFINEAEKEGILETQLIDAFKKRFYGLWIDFAMLGKESVYSFRTVNQEYNIERFKEFDKQQFNIAKARIINNLTNKLPDTNRSTAAYDEVGILKRELEKKRKIKPLRRLFKEIPNLLKVIKPCLMMSPLSVSYFLKADGFEFDIVIFDEASQVCTEDAIGAIMRSKQVIIAGDNKQLPPTKFFAASTSDDIDYDVDDEDYDDSDAFESVLDEARTILPSRPLNWHYRSKHEHLIAFSNAKIYNNRLITFPSCKNRVKHFGVEYTYVSDGVYDRSAKRNNIIEGKKVVELITEHIKENSKRTLGIVAFSGAQQNAIEELVRQFRLNNQEYEWFFNEDKEEAFFVKNLENVQGDERDTIIFSIGYAKDHNGIMHMNLGPLSRMGGERRLNVAITRAKYNVKLVGSIMPTDIDLNRTTADGVKLLRSYIDFAINGESVIQNEVSYSIETLFDSPFEEAVYNYLVERDYKVKTQVGCSGYRIDLAVSHPTLSGRFVLGIECDGATYHSARTARERDRIRQTVLEDIGWKIYRIWSTDWIKDPKTEGEKVVAHIEKCISEYKEELPNIASENVKKKHIYRAEGTSGGIEDYLDEIELAEEDSMELKEVFQRYIESDPWEYIRKSNQAITVSSIVRYIVQQEGPIHFEMLCQRVAPCLDREKVTSIVRDNVECIYPNIKDEIDIRENFYWLKSMGEVKARIPHDDDSPRSIKYICKEEIADVMLAIITNSIGITEVHLFSMTANLFGFKRKGNNVMDTLRIAYNFLIDKQRIHVVDEKILVLRINCN